jgi:serine protease Do
MICRKKSNSQKPPAAIKYITVMSKLSLLACISMVIVGFVNTYTNKNSSSVTTSPIRSKILEPKNYSNRLLLPNVDSKDFVAKVVQQVQPAVVQIDADNTVEIPTLKASVQPRTQFFLTEVVQSQEQVQHRSGSGFVINSDGYIVTNAHVVKNSNKVMISLLDGRSYEGKVLGIDLITDIAVVKIPVTNLSSVKLGNSDQVLPGDWTIAIGNPLGFQRSVSVGIVSGINRSAKQLNISERHIGIIQTDAALYPGNSGGPLLDAYGRVIGVNTASIREARNLGFAIPIDIALKIAQEIISKGKAEHPYLGVEVKPNNSRNIFGLREQGVIVLSVIPGSSSQKAGLKVGDTITKINNQSVNNADEVLSLVESSNVGSSLQLQLQRQGRSLQVKVKLDPISNFSELTQPTH